MPGLPCVGWQGDGRAVGPGPGELRDPAWIRGLLENPESPTYFGKVPGCDGMNEWKKNSKLDAADSTVADFVASFAHIPADMTPDEWLTTPGVAKHPGLEPFQKECGTCHAIDGFTEGGIRRRPGFSPGARPAGSRG